MSLSKALRPMAFAGLLLGMGLALGACSFSPVYSGALADQPMLNLAYAKLNSRLEQVIYQELSLRFGSSSAETAPLAKVTASRSVTTEARSVTANPGKPRAVTVTATLTITKRDGTQSAPVTITRSATAEYTQSDQIMANNAAVSDAEERAAKAAAESLRLGVLAALSR